MWRNSYILMLFLLILGASAELHAAEVEASWDAVVLDVDNQPETISHYLLFYGPTQRPASVVHPGDGSFQYAGQRNVGTVLTANLEDLPGGQRVYFSAVAADTSGNLSNYSAEVAVDLPEDSDGGTSWDAGTQPDAGSVDETEIEGGCGCGGDPATALWMLVFAPFAARRRRKLNRSLRGPE
ncbi:MAG: hypothetical protein JRF33_06895 [Deltaproteobacteria bacterium]|nr:hypothetical protein [Deltaproteobacteria bacterium]